MVLDLVKPTILARFINKITVFSTFYAFFLTETVTRIDIPIYLFQ